jgi:hypothetical protein
LGEASGSFSLICSTTRWSGKLVLLNPDSTHEVQALPVSSRDCGTSDLYWTSFWEEHTRVVSGFPVRPSLETRSWSYLRVISLGTTRNVDLDLVAKVIKGSKPRVGG